MNALITIFYLYLIGNAFMAGMYHARNVDEVVTRKERIQHDCILSLIGAFGLLMLLWKHVIEPVLNYTQVSFLAAFFFTKRFNNLDDRTILFLQQAMPLGHSLHSRMVRWTFRLVLKRNKKTSIIK